MSESDLIQLFVSIVTIAALVGVTIGYLEAFFGNGK
jgi:hypothetical protein